MPTPALIGDKSIAIVPLRREPQTRLNQLAARAWSCSEVQLTEATILYFKHILTSHNFAVTGCSADCVNKSFLYSAGLIHFMGPFKMK